MSTSGAINHNMESDERATLRPETANNTTTEPLETHSGRGKLLTLLEKCKTRINRSLQRDAIRNVLFSSHLVNFYKAQAEMASSQIRTLSQQLEQVNEQYQRAILDILAFQNYRTSTLSSTEFIPGGQTDLSLQDPRPGTSAVSYPTQSFPQQLSYPTSETGVSPATPVDDEKKNSVTAPAPPPGPKVVVTSPAHQKRTLLSQEALRLIPTRSVSARAKLGVTAVLEARKGLSRVIQATSKSDIECFKKQLQGSDPGAIEKDWESEDKLPIFAVSYMQHTPALGRFKFNEEQWDCFVCIVEQLAENGVDKFRIWLDQCLWLRDASQGGWAHTGILPYILWPVISLGKKKAEGQVSVETEERMWPFLEEVSGLWGMGVMFGREMRSKNSEAGWRKWMSYVHRARLEPEECMKLLLLNIFHGATDDLKTGWQDDVRELKEMARANVLMDCSELFIGSDWKQRLNESKAKMKGVSHVLQYLALPVKSKNGEGTNADLDGSRTVISTSWDGLRAWLSGDCNGVLVSKYLKMAHISPNVGKVQIICEEGEFELLQFGKEGWALWMLVCMEGLTSNFSRGKVAWTKIVTGLESCQLSTNQSWTNALLEQVLEKQLQRPVKVVSFSHASTNTIEWE